MRALRPAGLALLATVLVTCGTRTPPPSSAAVSAKSGVPILMFHHIATVPARGSSPTLYVPAGLFRRQMSALAGAGYHAVTLAQVVAAWRGGPALPARPVVLSFDDGYTDQYTQALPTLRAHHWPGVLYLLANTALAKRLSSDQVRRFLDAGWELGAHSLTHADLTKVSATRLRHEVADSRAILATQFATEVTTFAYPFGHADARVERAVRAAGYVTATTTQFGIARPQADHERLPRIIVTPDTTPATLLAQIAG